MRRGVLYRIAGRLLWFAVATLAIPLATSLITNDGTWYAWLIASALAALLSLAIVRLPAALAANSDSLRRREGFVTVVFGWVVIIFFLAIAYHLTGEFAGFAEAIFESCSGFTTTGATIAPDIEALPPSILIARSLSHWVGGMGIIVLSVAILPELSVGGMQMFNAEASGIDADKLAPRLAATARRLWILYVAISLILTVLLALGPMTLFDAFNHSVSTIATGGFSTKQASIGHYQSLYIEILIIVFMFVSGISFTVQYRAFVTFDHKALLKSPEVRLYTIMTIAAISVIAIDLFFRGPVQGIGEAIRQSSFTTVSVMTTTGFGIANDWNAWPDFSKVMLIGLMLIGGCAGSTAGGSKVIRLYVVASHAFLELRRLVRPRQVTPLLLGDHVVDRETTEAMLGFYLLYFAATLGIGLGLTALGMDMVSGSTAAISAMNSVGPGFGSVSAHFIDVPDLGLYLSSFGMLLGRLEIYPVLVIMTVHFWRRG